MLGCKFRFTVTFIFRDGRESGERSDRAKGERAKRETDEKIENIHFVKELIHTDGRIEQNLCHTARTGWLLMAEVQCDAVFMSLLNKAT